VNSAIGLAIKKSYAVLVDIFGYCIMTQALVIGASGLIGSHLMRVSQQRGWQVMGTYHKFALPRLCHLSLINEEAVKQLILNVQPQIIFLPAFCSNADYCELHPQESYEINVIGSLNVIQAAYCCGAKLVFYSSDYIFDGLNGPYKESDQPNPICTYGSHKLAVEKQIVELLDNHLILRTTVVYGHEHQGKNFVQRLVRTLKAGEQIRVPIDQIGSPTLADDIAEASCQLVEKNAQGIFHVVGPDLMSRYKFAVQAAKVLDLPTDLIIPVRTMELGQASPRPLQAGMIADRVYEVLNWQLRGALPGLQFFKEVRSDVNF
jgi:dTDP-4-dehydrorhamnose reductase